MTSRSGRCSGSSTHVSGSLDSLSVASDLVSSFWLLLEFVLNPFTTALRVVCRVPNSCPNGTATQTLGSKTQVRREKNSLLGHVAIQRIQGERQQAVNDMLPLHQVASGDVPAIEGIGPSDGPISNSDHNNLGTVLAFLSSFLLAFLPLTFAYSLHLYFISLLFPVPCPFSCQVPCKCRHCHIRITCSGADR